MKRKGTQKYLPSYLSLAYKVLEFNLMIITVSLLLSLDISSIIKMIVDQGRQKTAVIILLL